MATKKRLTLIYLIDGARPDIMQELLELGDLPNIQKEIVTSGTFRTATSCLPSTTGPADLPFLTGCFPGTLNVPGIRWLDKTEFKCKRIGKNRFRSYNGIRARRFNDDLSPKYPTLHELFDRSFSIFSLITRNLPKKRDLTRSVHPFVYLYAHLTDRWSTVDRTAHHHLMRSLDDAPDFVFANFPGVDCYSHLRHPHHEETLNAYRFVDFSVGKVVDKLKRLGRWDDTLLIITSDHGLTATHTHLDLALFLQHRGLKTLYYPIIWKSTPRASVMISGNAFGHVYLLDGDYGEMLSGDEVKDAMGSIWDELLEREEIDFVAWRGGNSDYRIQSRRGRARIIRHAEGLSYQPEGGDPLGLGTIDKLLTRQQALAATFDSEYPDALVQIDQLFSSLRSGDLVVVSRIGYDLRKAFEWPEHHGSHGSLCQEHMKVPLIYNQTGWDPRPARTADLFNTILKWSEKPPLENTDGQSLC